VAEEAFCLKSAPVDVPGFVVPGFDMEPTIHTCTHTVNVSI